MLSATALGNPYTRLPLHCHHQNIVTSMLTALAGMLQSSFPAAKGFGSRELPLSAL